EAGRDVDPDRVEREPATLDLDSGERGDDGVGRPLGRVHGLDRSCERLHGAPRALVQGPPDGDPRRGAIAEALRPVGDGGVATGADVGDDRRDVGHGTSRSTGTTRIDEAPAAFSGGSRSQISSASTAAWTAIWPASASGRTDGAPIPGSSSRMRGSAASGAFSIT